MSELDAVEAYLNETVEGEVSVTDTEAKVIWVVPKFLKNEDEKEGYSMALENALQARFGDVGTSVLPEGPIVVTIEQ